MNVFFNLKLFFVKFYEERYFLNRSVSNGIFSDKLKTATITYFNQHAPDNASDEKQILKDFRQFLNGTNYNLYNVNITDLPLYTVDELDKNIVKPPELPPISDKTWVEMLYGGCSTSGCGVVSEVA